MNTPTTVQWLRTAGTRIYTGSTRLATHYAARSAQAAQRRFRSIKAWLASSTGLKWLAKAALLVGAAWILRKIIIKVGGGLYERLHSGTTWLLWPAAALWILAAYRAGHPDWKPKQAPAEDESKPAPEDGQEQPAQPAATPASAPSVPQPPSPTELIAAVRDIGTPNAQLVPLATHLHTTTDAVRASAGAMGWRVKDVRQDGRSTSAGLRWDEAPSPEQGYPFSSVVGAGQRADDDNDDSGQEGPREGIKVERSDHGQAVYDLAEQHRIRGTADH
ncbi:hypothetical protein [Streptomyces sp. DSM 40484]|uniref:hypothetical protein n=1 Tax=Streptomyces kroppenstedtii TaxID=3051181 RepID=UPI0028D2FD51|nr:hypothetical protein [Streptomyces sp. DSM 40484]